MSKVQEEIRNIIRIDVEIARLTADREKSKRRVQKYMDDNNLKTIEVEQTDKMPPYIVKCQERANIVYDIEVLRKNIPADIFNEIIVKTYVISNMQAMVKLLRDAGINPKDFKNLLSISESVNKTALKQLYAVGDITREHLQGAYTATITKSIQIKEKKVKEDDE